MSCHFCDLMKAWYSKRHKRVVDRREAPTRRVVHEEPAERGVPRRLARQIVHERYSALVWHAVDIHDGCVVVFDDVVAAAVAPELQPRD